ncbi:MAG TPA: GNAT family protein [Caldimonas sp.]|nr:GNAT family protein [Caldimonas sp.]
MLEIAPATDADIPFVMATERLDGYDAYVGRWSEPQHRAALRDGRHTYFVARLDGEPVGFTIIRDWASPECVTAIKRIAVAQPGRGHGRAILARNVDAVFAQTGAYRLWLGVFPDNDRARRAYEAVGFQAEGVARGNAFFGGRHRDELVMSILRPEWAARRGRA